MRPKFDAHHDRAVADDAGLEFALRCRAHGCPCAWSVDFGAARKLCSAHAHAAETPGQWRSITERLLVDEAERARSGSPPAPMHHRPADRAAALAALAEIRAGRLFKRAPGKAWAYRLMEAEHAGRSLSSFQRQAWREALGDATLGSAAAHAILDQAAVGVPVAADVIAEALETTGDIPACDETELPF
jgi:hypothetical protein